MRIVLKSLRVCSGQQTLIKDVSFELNSGNTLALIGESGAGKSLTCAALAGTLPPNLTAHGTLQLAEETEAPQVNLLQMRAASRPAAARIAVVAQDSATALYPLMGIKKQISLAAQGAGSAASEATALAGELLERVGLTDPRLHNRRPGQLSGGQRQRAAIALAIASRPAALIADEPTTALDVVTRQEILELLHTLAASPDGPALILISHDLAAAAQCDQMVVLHDGVVIGAGSPQAVLHNPQSPQLAQMLAAAHCETSEALPQYPACLRLVPEAA